LAPVCSRICVVAARVPRKAVPSDTDDVMQCAALCVGSEELPQLGFVPHGCVPVAIDAPQPPADASAASLAARWLALLDVRAEQAEAPAAAALAPLAKKASAAKALPPPRARAADKAALARPPRAASPDLFSSGSDDDSADAAPSAATPQQPADAPPPPPLCAAEAQLAQLAAIWADPRALQREMARCDSFLGELSLICA
jgi:hypothetical protein